MEEYVRHAIKKSLRAITFLEHMESGIVARKSTWLTHRDFDYYFEEGMRLRSLYENEIEIRLGVECGYNPEHADTLLEQLAGRSWDEIGISCHFLKITGEKEHLNLLSKRLENTARFDNLDCSALFTQYLQTLEEAVTVLPGTVLCHLDAALRWVEHHKIQESHYERIDELLGKVKEEDMALEINTSGVTIRNEPFPDRRILSMAQRHGLRFVLGSDAHSPEDVGNHFERFSSRPSSKQS